MLGLFSILFLLQSLLASEPDNFTDRPTRQTASQNPNALNTLNEKTNALLETTLLTTKGCDLKSLHLAIKSTLGAGEVGMIGKLEIWAIESTALEKTVIPYSKSIYADAGLRTKSGGLFTMGIVPSVILGGHYVGVDKLSHFIDQGYDYFESIHVRNNDPVEVILKSGLEDEKGVSGMAGNGILSYADMAANFDGYRFWREVTSGPNPYYKCQNGKYVRTSRMFDWAQYASDAWDEAINCSIYSTAVEKVVNKALKKLGVTCPIESKICQQLASQMCGFTYLSPACLSQAQNLTLPDAACMDYIQTAKTAVSECSYQPNVLRHPALRDPLNIKASAEALYELRKNQALNWTTKTKDKALRKAVEQWGLVLW